MKTKVLNPMANLENLVKKGVKIYGSPAEKIAKSLDPEVQSMITQLEAKGIDCVNIKAQIKVELSSEEVGNLELSFPERNKKGQTHTVTVKNIKKTYDKDNVTSIITGLGTEDDVHSIIGFGIDITELCRFAKGETTMIEQ